MIIRTKCGEFLAIGGPPEEINPLFLSLYNWGGLDRELLNLGLPQNFVYFLIRPEHFVYYRAVAFCNSEVNKKKTEGFIVWDSAVLKANEELDSLRENGQILRWSAHLANLDFSQLEFDFLLIDLREKDARIQLGKQDLSDYHLVIFARWFQKQDEYVEELKGHCVSSLPKRWVSKQDFLSQLTTPKISSPNALKSFLRLILACWK
jgi:hypothetical protein